MYMLEKQLPRANRPLSRNGGAAKLERQAHLITTCCAHYRSSVVHLIAILSPPAVCTSTASRASSPIFALTHSPAHALIRPPTTSLPSVAARPEDCPSWGCRSCSFPAAVVSSPQTTTLIVGFTNMSAPSTLKRQHIRPGPGRQRARGCRRSAGLPRKCTSCLLSIAQLPTRTDMHHSVPKPTSFPANPSGH